MTSLEGRRVLVVGASAGVGREFARCALAQGAQVVLAARRTDRLQELVADAGHGVAVAADISDQGQREALVERTLASLGSVDLVFNSVGVAPLKPLASTASDDWRRLLETNVIGVQGLIAGLVPHLTPGSIVAVLSSETVGRPRPGLGAYGASKAALSESLRAWRLEHPGIRFSCVALGATQPTEFGDAFDLEIIAPLLDTWAAHGLMQKDFMETSEVAALLADLLASALRYPGVGVEEIVLRSPSDVSGAP